MEANLNVSMSLFSKLENVGLLLNFDKMLMMNGKGILIKNGFKDEIFGLL